MSFLDDCVIYIYSEPVDWRCGIYRLQAMAEILCGIDLRGTKSCVVFYNKRRTALRLITWRNDALMLMEARLDAGAGRYPLFFTDKEGHKVSTLTKEQLEIIFSRGVGEVKFSRSKAAS